MEGVYGWPEEIFELGYAKLTLPKCWKINIKLVLGGKKSQSFMIPTYSSTVLRISNKILCMCAYNSDFVPPLLKFWTHLWLLMIKCRN